MSNELKTPCRFDFPLAQWSEEGLQHHAYALSSIFIEDWTPRDGLTLYSNQFGSEWQCFCWKLKSIFDCGLMFNNINKIDKFGKWSCVLSIHNFPSVPIHHPGFLFVCVCVCVYVCVCVHERKRERERDSLCGPHFRIGLQEKMTEDVWFSCSCRVRKVVKYVSVKNAPACFVQ